jgi:hypothetical protein
MPTDRFDPMASAAAIGSAYPDQTSSGLLGMIRDYMNRNAN